LKTLSEAWIEECGKLWYLVNNNDKYYDEATLWDAFKMLYIKSVHKDRKGRKGTAYEYTD
jgi:hypothetical protein